MPWRWQGRYSSFTPHCWQWAGTRVVTFPAAFIAAAAGARGLHLAPEFGSHDAGGPAMMAKPVSMITEAIRMRRIMRKRFQSKISKNGTRE